MALKKKVFKCNLSFFIIPLLSLLWKGVYIHHWKKKLNLLYTRMLCIRSFVEIGQVVQKKEVENLRSLQIDRLMDRHMVGKQVIKEAPLSFQPKKVNKNPDSFCKFSNPQTLYLWYRDLMCVYLRRIRHRQCH